jgi:TolB-like protein
MADIFISYSSKDREKAKKLAGELQALGYSTWMDVSDLEPSARWSTEIVEAIEVCRILALLLSKASLASENVVKELSLAAEKKKHILPIVLEKTKLNPDFEYHLAGLQHTSIDNLNAIVRALEHLVASQAHVTAEKPPLPISDDTRPRIAVLPLDDYSPARDNDWFAEGLASELISKLSKMSQLFVVDRLTSREYKDTRLGAKQIAAELQVRYLVSGAVRKAGERIHIDVTLIDTAQGQTLWDDSYPGIMDDIFAIQDEVATKIAESLKIILTKDEERTIRERPTENPDAYELGLRAISYVNRNTKQDYLYAITMCEEALALDPKFVWACGTVANACLAIHRIYDRSAVWLTKAQDAIDCALAISPYDVTALTSLAILQLRRGDSQEALRIVTKAVELEPNNEIVLFQLGYVYDELGEYAKAADAYERSAQLVPNSLDTLFALLSAHSRISRSI